jgi:Asp-tRNA(Asn)/Glu-tRNA(Gln) amidotransferase A subunit family amidase
MADLFRLSASEAAARIREGKLTSEALVRSCLERIDSRESQVKAWVHLDHDFTASAQLRLRGHLFGFGVKSLPLTFPKTLSPVCGRRSVQFDLAE